MERNETGQPAFVLLPEEQVIFKTNPHWLFVVAPEGVSAILGIMILKYLSPFLPEQGEFLLLVGAAWAFVMTVIFLQWVCTTYSLTNLRLLEERGIIGRRVVSIRLESVQDITCTFRRLRMDLRLREY